MNKQITDKTPLTVPGKRKKAFTLVELIVVIAIIAILSTVAVVGYTRVVDKANVSNDTQLVSNLNDGLEIHEIDNKKPQTFHDALTVVEKFGFTTDKIKATSKNNDIVWDMTKNRFSLIDGDSNVIFAESNKTHLWKIYNEIPTSSEYSIYLAGTDLTGVVNASVGVDVGNNDDPELIVNYTSDVGQDVVIRTNSASTSLTIDAAADTVKHYGAVGSLNIIAVANMSYHEYGQVAFAEIATGRIVLESDSKVEHIHLTATEGNFNDITVAKASDVQMPEFSRDPVEIPAEGKLVVALQEGTKQDDNKEYVWLTAVGIYEQVTVSDSKTDAKNNYAATSTTASQEQKTAAQQIANNISVEVGGDTYTVKAEKTPSGWHYVLVDEDKQVSEEYSVSGAPVVNVSTDEETAITTTTVAVSVVDANEDPVTSATSTIKNGSDKAEEKSNISIKFVNTDKYLYRVGNKNSVATSSLFEGDISDISNIEITNIQGDAGGNYANGNITFSGTGVVKITANGSVELLLEVVDAVNYGTNAGKVGTANPSLSATGYNVVLLNDVNASLSVSNGYTLHGNGFTVADTREADSDATIGLSKAYVYINGGIVDNVFFKGYEPTEQVPLGNTKRQSSSAVIVQGTGSQIYNCHISGGRYAVLFYNAKDAYMESSVIDGGSIGCVGISNAYVTLKDCTTTISTQGGLKGAGIHVPSVDNGHLTILGSFEQHNWVQSNDLPATYRSLVNDLYNNSDFKYDYDGKTYINAGIFFMSETNSINTNQAKEFITDANDSMYVYSTKISSGYTGTMRSAKAGLGSPEMVAVADTSTTQYGVLPTYKFDFTDKNYKAKESGNNNYCYYDPTAKKVMISYDKTTSDTTFSWDPNILSVTKFGNALIPEYSILPATGWTKVNGKVLFAEEGDYTVTYTYTDPYNYDKDLNSGSKTYTHTVNLNIVNVKPEAVVYHPVFTYADSWSSYSSKQVVVNNKTYIMPDATATSNNVESTTVGGQTIYYPIISLDGKNSGGNKYSSGKIYYFAPAFKAINIKDLNKDTGNTLYTYNTETTTWPHNVSATTKITQGVYFGYGSTSPYGAQTSATYEKYAKNANNGGLCFTSNEIERNVTENSVLVEFYYVGNDGITYYYYIKYHYTATTYKSGGSCVAKGTLITMADGTQKKIEDLEANDMIIAFNHESGKYESAPVLAVFNHGYDKYQIIELNFSDNSCLKLVEGHALFDLDLMKYVDIYPDNFNDYIGHRFIKYDVNTSVTNSVTLVSGRTYEDYSDCWGTWGYSNLSCITNGLLSIPSAAGTYNYFAFDDNLKYDEEEMKADIEKYGLYTYEDWAEYIPYEVFEAYNFKYFKVAIGKGLATEETFFEHVALFYYLSELNAQ